MTIPKSRLFELAGKVGSNPDARICVLTGAGISAESGIPTFRSDDGYWVRGSGNYTPEQVATRAFFDENPQFVWQWYLERFSACTAARPNRAHLALSGLAESTRPRCTIITQNIDGLHRRAGVPDDQLYEIHGQAEYVRCSNDCSDSLLPLSGFFHDEGVSIDSLKCKHCGYWLRPHVLWFDEYYNEHHYRFDSAMAAARSMDFLLVIGTTGSTNLPSQICAHGIGRGVPIVLVDPGESEFSRQLDGAPTAWHHRAAAGEIVPPLCRLLSGEITVSNG